MTIPLSAINAVDANHHFRPEAAQCSFGIRYREPNQHEPGCQVLVLEAQNAAQRSLWVGTLTAAVSRVSGCGCLVHPVAVEAANDDVMDAQDLAGMNAMDRWIDQLQVGDEEEGNTVAAGAPRTKRDSREALVPHIETRTRGGGFDSLRRAERKSPNTLLSSTAPRFSWELAGPRQPTRQPWFQKIEGYRLGGRRRKWGPARRVPPL